MKNYLYGLLLVGASFVLPLPAEAAQWVRVITRDDSIYSVDVESIKFEGNRRRFWSKSVYAEPQYQFGHTYVSLTKSIVADCTNKTLKIVRTVGHDIDGSLAFDFDTKYHSYFSKSSEEVIPGTLGESVITLVCNRGNYASTPHVSEVSYTSSLTKQQAVSVINRWLTAKQQIFAPPFNARLLDEVTTGPLYSDSIKSINWLRNNNALYRFDFQKIESSNRFSANGNKAVVEVRLSEDISLLIHGKRDAKQSSFKTRLIRYNLQFANGRWKVADYKIIQ